VITILSPSSLLSLAWVPASRGFSSKFTNSRFGCSSRASSSTSAMKLFLALMSVMLSISKRTGGKTTKELMEMSTDWSLEQ